MSRLMSILLVGVLIVLFCSSELFALGPPKGNLLEDTLNGIAKSLGGAINGLGESVGETVDGVGQFVKGSVDGVGRTLGETVNGIEKFVGNTANGVGRSLDGTLKGFGKFVEDSGEVALEVVEVAGGVALFGGVVFLYMMADCYAPYGYGYGY